MAPYAEMSKYLDVNFSLQGGVRPDKQTGAFVTYCPSLDIYSAGRTRTEAKRALEGAIHMYLRLCYERGILGRLLKDKGFHFGAPQVTAGAASPAQFISIAEHASEYDDMFKIDIPFHLIAQAEARKRTACLQ